LRIDKRVRKNATSYRNLQESFVRQHHALAGRLLRRIQAAQKTGTSINLIDLLIEEEVPDFDISFLERVLLFLRWMGYIRVSSILPMAIEAYLHSVRPVSSTDDGEDRRIYAMYDENRRLKMLRLAALQALVEIRDHERQIRFI